MMIIYIVFVFFAESVIGGAPVAALSEAHTAIEKECEGSLPGGQDRAQRTACLDVCIV
tara:strand:- start:111 stop:284 length:174 start_codon:yes stop_codon:yes gene_type:complete